MLMYIKHNTFLTHWWCMRWHSSNCATTTHAFVGFLFSMHQRVNVVEISRCRKAVWPSATSQFWRSASQWQLTSLTAVLFCTPPPHPHPPFRQMEDVSWINQIPSKGQKKEKKTYKKAAGLILSIDFLDYWGSPSRFSHSAVTPTAFCDDNCKL